MLATIAKPGCVDVTIYGLETGCGREPNLNAAASSHIKL